MVYKILSPLPPNTPSSQSTNGRKMTGGWQVDSSYFYNHFQLLKIKSMKDWLNVVYWQEMVLIITFHHFVSGMFLSFQLTKDRFCLLQRSCLWLVEQTPHGLITMNWWQWRHTTAGIINITNLIILLSKSELISWMVTGDVYTRLLLLNTVTSKRHGKRAAEAQSVFL